MHSRIIKIHLRSWVVILGCASLSELLVRSAGTEQMVLVILPSWLTAQWATLSSWYPWAALPCLDVGFNNTNKPACFFNVPSEAAFQNLISVRLSVCYLDVAFWALLSSTILESNALSQLWWPGRHRVARPPSYTFRELASQTDKGYIYVLFKVLHQALLRLFPTSVTKTLTWYSFDVDSSLLQKIKISSWLVYCFIFIFVLFSSLI